MEYNRALPGVEHRFIIKFLVKEKVKPAVIIRMLKVQYGYDTLSVAGVYDSNSPHAQIQSTTDRRITERPTEPRVA